MQSSKKQATNRQSQAGTPSNARVRTTQALGKLRQTECTSGTGRCRKVRAKALLASGKGALAFLAARRRKETGSGSETVAGRQHVPVGRQSFHTHQAASRRGRADMARNRVLGGMLVRRVRCWAASQPVHRAASWPTHEVRKLCVLCSQMMEVTEEVTIWCE